MTGTDFLQLRREDAPARGLADWLTDRLRAAVLDGRLVPGAVLPPTRLLAADLGVARGVVVEAYRRLGDEGLATARTGSGTVIAARAGAATSATPASSEPVSRRRIAAPQPSAVPARPGPGIDLDLSPGLPDLSAFPRAAWLRAERAALDATNATDLGYGDPRGLPALRAALAGWLARHRGVRADADDILVVSGVAQALALLAQVLVARGVRDVGVEDPGSRGARDQLVHWGVAPVSVPVDGDGVVVEELARLDPSAVMLTPAHQFPTGVVLAPHRRRDLLAWATDRRAGRSRLVIEDDYDAEHRYDRAPVPALQPSAPDAVVYAGSVSKTLAPGIRLGWVIAPPAWRAELVAAKHANDIVSPALTQLTLAGLIAGGDLDKHLRSVRARQRARRDALLGALRTHLPDAQVHGVAAGLHLLVTFPTVPSLDDVELARRLGAHGLLVQPLSWHRQRPGDPGLVVGYAAHPPGRLAEAGERLAAIVAVA